MGALLLALFAAMTPFVAEPEVAYAQTPSSDADLSDLSLTYNDGASDTKIVLSPKFAAGTTSYTATTLVPHVATAVSVMANPNHDLATIVGHPDDDGDDTASAAVTWVENLGSGGTKTAIRVTVRAENGTTKAYSVTVYRKRATESTNANLSSLSLGTGTMSPSFISSQLEYNARVATNVSSVTVSYTPSDNAGGVMVVVAAADGATVDTNNPKKVNLGGVGTEGTITLAVTPEAGAGANNANVKTYTMKVYRENPNLQGNVDLTGIAVNVDGTAQDLTPTFVATTTEYSVTVINSVEQVTVVPTKSHVGAMVNISPADADGGAPGHQVRLSAGSAVNVMVNVTAEDTSIKRTYMVKVYRNRSTLSTVNTLSGLSLSAGTLSPGFSTTVDSYDARVGSNVSMVTVNATPTDNAGGVGIAVTQSGGTSVSGMAVTLGAAGSTTTITVAVTSEDTTVKAKNYVIEVYRSRNAVLAQANIASIVVNNSAGGTAITTDLTPDFSPSVNSYNLIVDNSVGEVEFVPTLADATGATFDITPADSNTVAEHQVEVTAGMTTTVMIVVTAEDRTTTKTYTFNVYRKRAAADASDVDTLSMLSVSPGSLSPAFMTSRVDYTARVASSVGEITVSATPTDNAGGVVVEVGTSAKCDNTQTITHNAKVSLTAGAVTNVCVKVTAEDGTAMVYMIDAYRERASASDNAELTTFRIDEATGTANISTGENTTTLTDTQLDVSSNKTPDVAYRVREVTVVATASDVGSIVSITPADSDDARTGHQVALAEGAVTEIMVSVQPEDSSIAPMTFSTAVYRKNASTRISKDATLKSLSLSDVVLMPAFDPDTMTYTAAAAFSTKQTTVTAMPNHAGARNGVVILPDDADADTANTAPGHQVNLTSPGGEYTITVAVTPEAGAGANNANVKTYTVKVTRSATTSDDAKLRSLKLMHGGEEISLLTAKYWWNTLDCPQMQAVVGSGEMEGDMATYCVMYDDLSAAGKMKVDEVFAMSVEDAWNMIGCELMKQAVGMDNQAFCAMYADLGAAEMMAVYEVYRPSSFSVMVGNSVDMTTVVAEAAPGATVAGDGMYDLMVGANTITVTVTAEDEETMKTYIVMVTREAMSNEARLLDLYDDDGDGQIDDAELSDAIIDFSNDNLSEQDMSDLIVIWSRG